VKSMILSMSVRLQDSLSTLLLPSGNGQVRMFG